MKKTLIIISAALAAVLAALIAVLIIIKSGDKMVMAHLSSDGDASSNIFSSDTVSSEPEAIPVLTFSSHKSERINTTEDKITFKGNYTPNTEIFLGSESITTNKDGNFTITKDLQYGNNSFTFTVLDQTKTFSVYRRFVIISSYTPSTSQIYSAGAYFPVSVVAREGSQITATFNGATISLEPQGSATNGFITFSGKFSMPSGHFRDLNLGTVTFKGVYNSFSESFKSGNVTCKKEDIVLSSDPNATPKGGKYTDVGSGIITEIVSFQAETFDAGTKTDASKPWNNYLPKGTLDYGSADSFSVRRDGDTYELITLRCGRTLYKSYRDKPTQNRTTVIKQYVGTLPDHNEITFNTIENNGSHTVLNLSVNWKAPFYFELLPQSYNSDMTVTNISYNYVDITFCYATVFNGEIIIPQDNPVFSSAKVIQNTNDYTLRLFLKKPGAFYGWDAYYDANGNLCFEFLNPAKITLTNTNVYGADLSGVNILIDVGHGGMDCGALGSKGAAFSEANRNLNLANKIKAELVSIGATVYMTRTTDVTSTFDDKMNMIKRIKPDYCIAIHHDSNTKKSLNGFGAYYYTPFAKKAAESIWNHSFNTGIYAKQTLKLHKYFTLRSTVCPVVLTENGYMSNSSDYSKIIDDAINTKKAEALVKGIVEYFTHINK